MHVPSQTFPEEKRRFPWKKGVSYVRDYSLFLVAANAFSFYLFRRGVLPPHLHSCAWTATVLMAKVGPGRKGRRRKGLHVCMKARAYLGRHFYSRYHLPSQNSKKWN